MGGSAKKVLGVAIAVAIPFAAPKLVAAFAASSAVAGTALGTALGTATGQVVGSALVGAGLGAAGAGITGGDPRMGALMGGIGGGFGGYSAFTAPGAAVAPGTAEALGSGGLIPGSEVARTLAAQDAALFGTSGLQAVTTSPQLAALAGQDPTMFAGARIPGAPGGGPVQGGSFTEALKGVPGEIAGRFSDPKVLADITLRAGASLLTGQLAGDGLSEEEQQLLQAQMADLQTLREQDEELFRTRLSEAMGLLGEARYFDPAAFGMQAQARVQQAGAQQMREAERAAALRQGGAGTLTASEQRRAGLDVAARGQTAYAQGAESAQKQRLATYQAGLAALPTAGPTAGLTYGKGLMDMYGQADKRRRQVQEDMGDWFGSLTGDRKAASIG
jgi:hypothetical protein